jgi:protein-disulfide isomerase
MLGAALLGPAACARPAPPADPQFVAQWTRTYLGLVRTERISLPVTSRVGSSAGQLTGLDSPSRPEPDRRYDAAQDSAPLATRAKGRPDAPVTVYEMADFQCPACRTFALETMPLLEREYARPGKVRFVFINFPLTQIHPNAVAAAEVAMCAARQGKFWDVHDALFLRQPVWSPLREPGPYLLALADSAGVERQPLIDCVTSGATRGEIEADARRAARSGARSTPTFYIEGGLLAGAWPADTYRHLLDSIYRVKTAAP